jgi:hypothetical protein
MTTKEITTAAMAPGNHDHKGSTNNSNGTKQHNHERSNNDNNGAR